MSMLHDIRMCKMDLHAALVEFVSLLRRDASSRCDPERHESLTDDANSLHTDAMRVLSELETKEME